MEPFATPVTDQLQTETWKAYPLITPAKFIILCVASFGLYGLWWQYKTWRFFKQWQQTDTWPVLRAIFSLFTFNELLQTINQFAYSTGGYRPISNPTGLAAGYIILNLLARLPDPLWVVALGASGFLVPAYKEFRDAMLQAPAYGGCNQEHFSARQVVALALGVVFWGLGLFGMTLPD
ncbi:hypothetical protein IC235_17330 [Hymenobacter sp. BT664]|uniref:DUF4234 domain-containing protein n=1 Tax=Hymenobacter montanus TaxID=2771359 RepID=A0A927BF00_9BACT|nr:hypothetical protein [Hymenobacter montanus]MBD2769655.1 hypothetical protein [Hymenobacter montanus]